MTVAAQESTKLYALLQTAVDNEIQQVGWMPDATTYGMINGNGAPGNGHAATNGNHAPARNGEQWNCTDGQKGLLLRLINENGLNKAGCRRSGTATLCTAPG